MRWNELAILVASEAEEVVANLLNERGANGVVIEDPQELTKTHRQTYGEMYDLDETKYPDEGVRMKAYFPDDHRWADTLLSIEAQLQTLQLHKLSDDSAYKLTVGVVEEADWENEWKKYFKPKRITNRFTIVPLWETYERQTKDELIILIDPGMAFGTGEHPTTVLTMQGMESYIKPNDIVIDVGTGSGILSIAAALLETGHVYAYDLDPIAVRSASLNRDLNKLDHKITVVENNLLCDVNKQANVIVANILAHIIEQLIDDAWDNLVQGGYFITSGIIAAKKDSVKQKLIAKGFSIVKTNVLDNWISFVAQK